MVFTRFEGASEEWIRGADVIATESDETIYLGWKTPGENAELYEPKWLICRLKDNETYETIQERMYPNGDKSYSYAFTSRGSLTYKFAR